MTKPQPSLFDPPAEEIRREIDADVNAELRRPWTRFDAGDVSASRHRGSPTSEAAYEQGREASSELRERVYQFIWRRNTYGATVDEIAAALKLYPNQVSGCVSELVLREKSVVKTLVERKTRTGSMAAVVVAKVFA